ncbi:hypothetical protein A3E03_02995 [Candidatus Nomurabacteria bacterium RIFCSPHIGHO2_12_FULL_40_64]|nr:MAG: hypothetical protein A3E03_02995 [Candidatus Nomurabacteria bacterium RIFCSPHIGHO2_12_FULL_40_64]
MIKILFVLSKYYESKLLLISHLLLGEKSVRASAPNFENSLANSGETAWATLRVAHSFANSKPESFIREYLYDTARTYFIKNS